MPPGTLEIALLIGQALMKYGPDVARQIQLLFTKTNPTAADWEAVFALSEKTYDQFVAPLPKVP